MQTPYSQLGEALQRRERHDITEAESLVVEWKPNPAECETLGVQSEN